jgi:acetyl-CoA acetyltransferase
MAPEGVTPAAIVGVSDYIPAKGERISYWDLHARIVRDALNDAGLSHRAIDGVVFTRSGYPLEREVFPTTFCEFFGISPAWVELAPHGGAQMSTALWRASQAIASGLATTVLIVAADNRDSRFGRSGVVARIADHNMDTEFEVPYGPIFVTTFALMAQRYMHEYGVGPEVFAGLAVGEREWARMNPGARMREPLAAEDVLASRMISSPLRLLDICLVTDGGVAIVVTARDVAQTLDQTPVYIRGYGDAAESQTITALSDLARPALYRRAAEQAFAMAELGPEDVDLVYAYDPTTSFALWGLEEMGFAERGEAAALVESGALKPGGRLPLNTHGGLLSYGHPGAPGALLAVGEAVRQLRGTCGERQVKGARTAVTSAIGGFLACGVNVLSTAP